jgi:hypothetical protein
MLPTRGDEAKKAEVVSMVKCIFRTSFANLGLVENPPSLRGI